MTAKDIQKLLKYKHREDVYVPECKNGSTWFANHLRLDGLAIARSWANPKVTGYEIKVNRSDFINDEKLHLYTDYCNQMYIICPSKLIAVNEVPENVGLIWVAATGSRLFTKKKAPYRDIDISADLYKYILISRAEIKDRDILSGYGAQDARDSDKVREYWRNWLEKKKIDYKFGQNVSGSISRAYHGEMQKLISENANLKNRMTTYDNIMEYLAKMGIDLKAERWALQREVESQVSKINRTVHRNFRYNVSSVIEDLEKILTELEE